MIEFKQIIGRGTRIYDGKDYFTIYDFVRAHLHFQDPQWDGEPLPPDNEDNVPGVDRNIDPPVAGDPSDQENGPGNAINRRNKVRVKLADGKERTIQHMEMTSFWHPDGTPISAQEFMVLLFGNLPDIFQNEEELRKLWGDPESRRALLDKLAEKGFGDDQMKEMQYLVDAENSDLFDVLAYVAYNLPIMSREERVKNAGESIQAEFNAREVGFLDFVLKQYIRVGVKELSPEKLTPLIRLKYNNAISDAIAELGQPEQIKQIFRGFQKLLYRETGRQLGMVS